MNNEKSRKVVSWGRDALPTGFERTLSPSDPGVRAGVHTSGCLIRDNRRKVVISSNAALVADSEPPPPSDARVSGIRTGIPVAHLTRDDVPSPVQRHTSAQPAQQDSSPPLEVTPDFASEYVPPRPVPEGSQHKTFELKAVRLSPEIHPRTAPTVLNARTKQRRFDKQQKDARELAAFMQQSERRRRGPLIVVACLSVMVLGFVLGMRLVSLSAVKVEPEPTSLSPMPGEQPNANSMQGPAKQLTQPELAQQEVSQPAERLRSAKLARPSVVRVRSEPAPADDLPSEQAPSGAALSAAQQDDSPARQQAGPEAAPPAGPVREVWLR